MVRLITKPIRFEKHALRRVEQRDISEAHVRTAIGCPFSRAPAKRPGAIKITYQLNGTEILTVVIEETKEFIRVVTAWVNHA